MSATVREQIKVLSDKLENCPADQYDIVMTELKFLYDAKELKLKHYSDPSHGWISIKLKFLAELEILDDISSYSYIKGHSAYIEEDSDASLLLKTLKLKGYAVEFQEKYTNKSSPIRSYDRYTPDNAKKVI